MNKIQYEQIFLFVSHVIIHFKWLQVVMMMMMMMCEHKGTSIVPIAKRHRYIF